jgi:hypothetical protein
MSYLRRHHVGLLALFVALGGTSYAASQLPRNSVGSTQLRAGAVHASDISSGAVTLAKLDRGARGQLAGQPGAAGPQGPAGPDGPAGAQGPKGDTGTVDTANFFTKADSDARFLGIGAVRSVHTQVQSSNALVFDVGGVRANVTCGSSASALVFGNISGSPARIFDQTNGVVTSVGDGGSVALATANNGQNVHTVLQVAWGASLERMTTFVVSVSRPGGCPVEAWATAITNG